MSGDDSNYTMVRKNSKKDKEISYHILNESIVLKGESEFLNRMSNFVQNKYQKLVTPMYINICKKSLKVFLLLMGFESVPGVGFLLITPRKAIVIIPSQVSF